MINIKKMIGICYYDDVLEEFEKLNMNWIKVFNCTFFLIDEKFYYIIKSGEIHD
jgi:hypothetical protein